MTNTNELDLYRDPVFDAMDREMNELANWFVWPFSGYKAKNRGLKDAIKRPYNYVNIKDESGKVVAQELRVVTTPFAKEDVKVKIFDNTLSVTCGTENIKDNENETYLVKNISTQSYQFALSLDPRIDQTKITAANKDGMLTINMPLLPDSEQKPKEIEIAIA